MTTIFSRSHFVKNIYGIFCAPKEKWLIFDVYKCTIKTFVHYVSLWWAVNERDKYIRTSLRSNRWLGGGGLDRDVDRDRARASYK